LCRRGTPAGIPFPKDFFSGSCAKSEVLDASQVPPLNQRHTYFQEVHHGNQHRSLRRIIKPPARFKNSRMSLRPVHRPVLCAKCGVRCEDKSNSQGNSDKDTLPEPSTTDSNATSTPTSVKRNGIHRKKTHAKALGNKSETLLGRTSSSSKSSSRDTQSPVLQEDPNDYCYESVGSSGIIENAWKRPLSKPLKNQVKSVSGKTLSKQENPSFAFNGRSKSPPPPVLVPATCGSTSVVESSYCDKPPLLGLSSDKARNRLNLGQLAKSSVQGSQKPSTTIFRVTKSSSDVSKLSDEQSKMNNLKLCISKISCGKKRKLNENIVLKLNQSTPNLLCVTKMPGESDSQCQSGLSSNNKIKIKRRITKTPLRFRDQSYSTADGKTFSPMESDFSRIFPISDHEIMDKKVTEENCESNHVGTHTRTVSNPIESLHKTSPILSCNSSSTTNTSSSSSSSSNFNVQEPVKTPVLKILFDSKGSGMVVQIPSKATSQSPSLNGSELAESKAARKAMKKAKKEARKKHVSEPTKIALPPLTPQTVSSYGDNPSTILPPIRFSELNSSSTNELHHPPESTDWCSMSSDVEISPVGHPAKKRKKVKRRRKDKKSFRVKNEDSPEESTSSAIPTPSPPLVDNDEAVSSSTTTGPSIKFDKYGTGKYVFANHCSDTKDSESKEHREAQERVLISLKRLDTNAYTTVSKEVDQVPTSTNTNKTSEAINEDVSSDGPAALNTDEPCEAAESSEFYIHEKSNQIFRKGDVVWGQNIDKGEKESTR